VRAAPHSPGAEPVQGYTVIEHLARGRRLDVYDVWSAERGCRCILKAIRPERAHEAEARATLLEEGRLLESLTHPHIVRGYETTLEPMPAIVMETLPGETLAHMIESGAEATEGELGHLALQLGSAIRYLHANGALHLDLKPSNVVAMAGQAKVIDLSVARAPGLAPAGVGTPDYMAPEQARGGELGPPADVWGIGVVLFEALTGAPAFEVEADALDPGEDEPGEGSSLGTDEHPDERYAQLEGRAQRLAEARGPSLLARLIDDCLEPDAAGRPTVAELLERAERIAGVPGPERRWA